ncbi:MAG: hypothetical protein U1A06_07765 [Hoeflea sp.]|uniref:hypothetical protein n=1 Tax=Hoeflea sp. TaxID=1940281 RepID=UPI002731BB13|nr:hypothetical protein [Hoeflea sp.]MDP2121591.1 hypothetical protein [Hoeflea sp.]MDZ7601253.1 hypothetical protein [Hoeflea sp.]
MSRVIKDEAKTDAVPRKRAPGVSEDYVDRMLAWSKAFNARTKASAVDYDEKAFIDSLYEED